LNGNSNNGFTLFGSPASLIDAIEYLYIYDRWGGKVFSKTQFPINDITEGWDGTYRGQLVNPGVFVFTSKVSLKSGEFLFLRGDVTVIR